MTNNASIAAEGALATLQGGLTTESSRKALWKDGTARLDSTPLQFVPLLNWEEDRKATLPISDHSQHIRVNKASQSGNAINDADSDASISASSDDELRPAGRPVQRVTAVSSKRKGPVVTSFLAVETQDSLLT